MIYNPAELRIGNWINTYHGNVQVVSIGEEIYTTPNLIGATHGAMLYGIPLTPEILEKCGFVKDDWSSDDQLLLRTARFGFGFKNSELYIYDFQRQNSSASGIGNIEIKYLHQLQNLFFFLTGEELTYSP